MQSDVLFQGASGCLVLGQAFPGGGDLLLRDFEARRAASAALSSCCKAISRSRSAFMVCSSQKKGPAEAEPAFYML